MRRIGGVFANAFQRNFIKFRTNNTKGWPSSTLYPQITVITKWTYYRVSSVHVSFIRLFFALWLARAFSRVFLVARLCWFGERQSMRNAKRFGVKINEIIMHKHFPSVWRYVLFSMELMEMNLFAIKVCACVCV